MADPSLIERLRSNAKMIEEWAGQDERPTLTGFGLNVLFNATTDAASTLEDQARLIGECREVFEATVPALEEEIKSLTDNYINHSGPGKGKVTDPDGIAWIAQFQEPLDKITALLTKLNAFGERDE